MSFLTETRCHFILNDNNNFNNNRKPTSSSKRMKPSKSNSHLLSAAPSKATTSNPMISAIPLNFLLSLVVGSLLTVLVDGQQPLGDLLLGREQLQQPPTELTSIEQQRGHQSGEILVQPNSLVHIPCKLPPSASKLSKFHWNFFGTSAKEPRLLCYEDKCLDEDRSGYQLEYERESGAYDVIIKNATYEHHDGVYYCKYRDPETNREVNREFRLTVLIPPQPPVIHTPSHQAAREGQEHQLVCVTQGGNPEPNMTWHRNEQPLSQLQAPQFKIDQLKVNGTTSSTLTWRPTIEDHLASFRCSIWNKAMSSVLSYQHELYVEYAPRISVGAYNPLKVILGKPVTLPCSVDANPPVKSVRWFRDGQLVSNQFNYTLNEVKIQDAAVYTCQADNGIHPAQAVAGGPLSPNSNSFVETQLNLQVLYGPRVQVKPSKPSPLFENDYLTLNCSVDSWPPAHELVWTKADEPTFRQVSNPSMSFLEFEKLTAANMGNYTCTASNRMEPSIRIGEQPVERQASGSAMVLVRHKPGQAEISLGLNGETEVGSKTEIVCRAKPPGFPEPQYKFWKFTANGKKLLNKGSTGSTFAIYAARAEDEGRYGCSAANELGTSSEADGELIVNEVPVIVADKARPSDDTRAQGDHPYSITVRASGKPEPRVTWFHRSPVDGRRVELNSLEMMSKFKVEINSKQDPIHQLQPKFNVITTLTFKNPIEVDDRGLYYVEFNNGLSKLATEKIQLHVYHTPIPAPRNQPILASQPLQQQPVKVRAGFEPGETVNLTCQFSAHPAPTIQWFTQISTEPLDTNSRYRATTNYIKDDIYESVLTFEKAQEADYGEYTCVAANTNQQTRQIADAKIVVELTRKSAPEPPTQLEVIEANQDSVTIQWVPGFDGGFASNQYLVQYAPEEGSKLSLSKRFPNADSLISAASNQLDGGGGGGIDSQLKLYDCLSMNPCTINQLQQRQAYVFRLRAKNELGFSDFSDELRASTRANINQIPRILEASFDSSKNVLYFRIESNPDYTLINLNARIETRGVQVAVPNNELQQSPAEVQELSGGGAQSAQAANQQQQVGDWRLHATVPIRQERAEAYLNVQQDIEQLRITLCSRSNESLCGPEYVVSMKNAVSSFLQGERGLPLNMMVSSAILIVVIAAFATTIHTCCMSRKSKKADALDRADHSLGIDNKGANGAAAAASNGMLHVANGTGGSHGSTASTRSTSVANGGNQLHSMDSINGAVGNHLNAGYSHLMSGAHHNNGAVSDHSSDHSRQVKLDSMLPPNYNHYAIEQQAQLMQQQVASVGGDKLSSHFGLPNSALLGDQQMNSPIQINGQGGFTYGNQDVNLSDHLSLMSGHQQQQQQQHNSMMMNSVLDHQTPDGNLNLQMQNGWPMSDDYGSYNQMGFAADPQHQQQQLEQQMIDPTYGTTGGAGVVMSQQSAVYDNSANSASGQQQFYMGAYQAPQPQFQQDLQQQSLYGTLTRNGYATNHQAEDQGIEQSNNKEQQQQQQYITSSATSGLMQQQQLAPPPPPQESDYGTTGGGRGGRLIREIIV